MVVLAQLVRASACGAEGRGFEPHIPPKYGVPSFKVKRQTVNLKNSVRYRGYTQNIEKMKKEFDML